MLIQFFEDWLSMVRHFGSRLAIFPRPMTWTFRILDTLQIAFMTQAVYSYLVIDFLNITAIENLPW
jgi:hypothetical protein